MDKTTIVNSIKSYIVYASKTNTSLSRELYRKLKSNTDPSEKDIIEAFGGWKECINYCLSVGSEDMDNETVDFTYDHLDNTYPTVIKKSTPKNKLYRVLVIPDIHVPFHSVKAVDCMLKFATAYRPDEVIQLGDLLDFYKISRYMKSPGRGQAVQVELDKASILLKNISKVSQAKTCSLLIGNHEERLKKYLCNNAPSLTELRALELENLLGLTGTNWSVIKSSLFYQIGSVYFTHGEFVTTHSALKHISKYDETIVHGHTHKIKCTMHKGLNRTIEGWEIGCLAGLHTSEEYQKMADWQHGFATVEILNDDYWITPYHIRNNKVSYNGSVIEGENIDSCVEVFK